MDGWVLGISGPLVVGFFPPSGREHSKEALCFALSLSWFPGSLYDRVALRASDLLLYCIVWVCAYLGTISVGVLIGLQSRPRHDC